MHRSAAVATAALCFWASTAALEAQNQYRCWLGPITYTCTDLGGSVQVAFDNQDVEFNNLPANAQFTLNYMQNGVTTTSDGPFTVEQTSGTRDYGSFATSFAA